MAVTTKRGINIAQHEKKYFPIGSNNVEFGLMTLHLVVSGLVGEFTVKFKQGNQPNKVNNEDDQLVGADILVDILDCEGNSTDKTISSDGNYFIAIDTFYGKYANFVIERNTATAGLIDLYGVVAKK